jgi:hypothetical protein
MKFSLFLLAGATAFAVNIGTPSVTNAEEHYARVTASIDVDSYVQIYWGTTMGGPYSYCGKWCSVPYLTGQFIFADSGHIALDIWALQPGTTYYGVIVAYSDSGGGSASSNGTTLTCVTGCPFASRLAGQTITYNGSRFTVAGVASGGATLTTTTSLPTTFAQWVAYTPPSITATSSEFTATTTGSGSGPFLPATPTVYHPAEPSLTNYTIVPMHLANNAWVATSTVSHTAGTACPSDPGWTVTAGDSEQTVINEVQFGAVLRHTQAGVGQITAGYDGLGYRFPTKTVDPCASGISDPIHRWIIVETDPGSGTDFPPYGFRESPGPWAAKQAVFRAETQSNGALNQGQVFDFQLPNPSEVPVHHYWFRNIQVTVDPSMGSTRWGPLILISNTEGNPNDVATPASYLVFDRVYVNGQSWPVSIFSAINGGVGTNVEFIGSYINNIEQVGGLGAGIAIQFCSTGPLNIENTYISAAGQGIYLETAGELACGSRPRSIIGNVMTYRNTIYNPPTWLNPQKPGYGTWDGNTRGLIRNPWEAKGCFVCEIKGNYFDGSFGGANPGQAILLTPTGNYLETANTGMHDISVISNEFAHVTTIADMWGTSAPESCCGYAPQSALLSRVDFKNNFSHDSGWAFYAQTNIRGIVSDYFENAGVQDLHIENNTLGFDNSDISTGFYPIPWIISMANGNPLSAGFRYVNNIDYFSLGTGPPQSGIGYGCGGGGFPCTTTFPQVPAVTTTTYNTILNTTAVQLNATETATGVWTGNVHICGNKVTGSFPSPDMTSSDCTTQQANMPGGDTWAAGNTVSARESNVGYTPSTGVCTGCGGAGANLKTLLDDEGVVQGVSATSGTSTSITLSYTFNTATPCSVDLSTSSSFPSPTRMTDSGVSGGRTLTFKSLTNGTTYYYRIMCVYRQVNDGSEVPPRNWPTSQVTEGSWTAGAGAPEIPPIIPMNPTNLKATVL